MKSKEHTEIFITPIDRETFSHVLLIGHKEMIKATKTMKVGDIVAIYIKTEKNFIPGIYGYGVVTSLAGSFAELTVTKFVKDRPIIELERLKKYTRSFGTTCRIKYDKVKMLHVLNMR